MDSAESPFEDSFNARNFGLEKSIKILCRFAFNAIKCEI